MATGSLILDDFSPYDDQCDAVQKEKVAYL